MDSNIIYPEKISQEEIIKKNNQDINRRLEIEKELNIQRKGSKKYPNSYDMKMNHLKYYHQIAKNNIQNLMNNPTMKDIYRITSNESIFDILKEKEEQSKELSKFLEHMPLQRVERINYKGLEIGNMRKNLQKNDDYVNINKEKGEQIAGNLFEKRKKEGSVNFIPVLSMDNMETLKTYNLEQKKIIQNENQSKNILANSNNETWFKKYKHYKNINLQNNDNNNNEINKENIIQVNRIKKDENKNQELDQDTKPSFRRTSSKAEKQVIKNDKKPSGHKRTLSMEYNQTKFIQYELKNDIKNPKLNSNKNIYSKEQNEKKGDNNNAKIKRAYTNKNNEIKVNKNDGMFKRYNSNEFKVSINASN